QRGPDQQSLVVAVGDAEVPAPPQERGVVDEVLPGVRKRSRGPNEARNPELRAAAELEEDGTNHYLERGAEREVGVSQRRVSPDLFGSRARVVEDRAPLEESSVSELDFAADPHGAQVEGMHAKLQPGPEPHRLNDPCTAGEQDAQARCG